ncbi:MAG: methyl-accepting chemotaxis protein [Candidatus Omnitrophota bacterium]
MPARPIFRRRRYIIKTGLQFRYIGLVFILALLASMVTGWTVFATGWAFLGEKLAGVYPQGRLVYIFRATNMALIRNLLLVSPLVFVLALLFSHKIAGPVYRIEKDLGEIQKGNLGLKIKLRQNDELVDLAEAINALTEGFFQTVSVSKENIDKLQKDLDGLKKSLAGQPDACSRIDSLQAAVNSLKNSCDKWRLS